MEPAWSDSGASVEPAWSESGASVEPAWSLRGARVERGAAFITTADLRGHTSQSSSLRPVVHAARGPAELLPHPTCHVANRSCGVGLAHDATVAGLDGIVVPGSTGHSRLMKVPARTGHSRLMEVPASTGHSKLLEAPCSLQALSLEVTEVNGAP